jgi:hypothetical protein
MSSIGMGIEEICQSIKGRIFMLTPIADFTLVKGGIIVLCCTNSIVLRGIGLDNNPPRPYPPSRPPPHLTQELESALTSPKIWEVEAGVGRDYPY